MPGKAKRKKGEGAPLSKSSIRRLRAGWTAEFEEWSQRRLEGREVVYVWADGIYVKAGLERDKAALLVVLGAMRDGTKEVLALRSGYRESVESWSEVLRDLKARGIEAPRLLMAEGNAAIWGARGIEAPRLLMAEYGRYGLRRASNGAGTTR